MEIDMAVSRPLNRVTGPLNRVTVNLVPRATAALAVASETTGDNQTDVLNRSVQVYAYLMKVMEEGSLVFIEHPTTGARERLVLL